MDQKVTSFEIGKTGNMYEYLITYEPFNIIFWIVLDDIVVLKAHWFYILSKTVAN